MLNKSELERGESDDTPPTPKMRPRIRRRGLRPQRLSPDHPFFNHKNEHLITLK